MAIENLKNKYQRVLPDLKKELGLTNSLAVPRLVKVVVSSGTGKAVDKKKKNELVADRLSKITGQKPSPRPAKQSIASFKLRQGDIIGQSVTLRGNRMYAFLDKLINVAIPRSRDFKGYTLKSIDEMGNLTLAVKEHVVFPETSDEDLKDVFGLAVTVITSATDRQSGEVLFKHLDFPFKETKKVA
ncbi:MAG: 50S ribosomal protein L5 [Patescibacteria group bacterium]